MLCPNLHLAQLDVARDRTKGLPLALYQHSAPTLFLGVVGLSIILCALGLCNAPMRWFPTAILRGLKKKGILHPTPIQIQGIPTM